MHDPFLPSQQNPLASPLILGKPAPIAVTKRVDREGKANQLLALFWCYYWSREDHGHSLPSQTEGKALDVWLRGIASSSCWERVRMLDGLGVAGSHLATKRVADLGLHPMHRAGHRKLMGSYVIIKPLNQSILRPGMLQDFLLVK